MKLIDIVIEDKKDLEEKWSQKYKNSINCSNPKGFSQKAHCAGKKKVNEGGVIDMMELAKRAKALLAQGMSEQQAQDKLVKEGIPARLAAQAVQMAQMQETVADQLTDGFTQAHADAKRAKQEKLSAEKYEKSLAGQYKLPCQPMDSYVVDSTNKPIVRCANPDHSIEVSVALNQYISKAKRIDETPIAATDDPMDPMIHSHEKANPMTLKGRILQTRRQLQELAKMAESDDLAIWVQITKLAKGGMFMGLEQNLEQVRHGLEELAAKRKKGGVQSRGIEKFNEDPSAGTTNSGNMQVGAIYKNKAGKTPKNKDGTAKNALDMKANLLTGGSIAKR
jgi:hypothetical protein